jgi:hypothetical protein
VNVRSTYDALCQPGRTNAGCATIAATWRRGEFSCPAFAFPLLDAAGLRAGCGASTARDMRPLFCGLLRRVCPRIHPSPLSCQRLLMACWRVWRTKSHRRGLLVPVVLGTERRQASRQTNHRAERFPNAIHRGVVSVRSVLLNFSEHLANMLRVPDHPRRHHLILKPHIAYAPERPSGDVSQPRAAERTTFVGIGACTARQLLGGVRW